MKQLKSFLAALALSSAFVAAPVLADHHGEHEHAAHEGAGHGDGQEDAHGEGHGDSHGGHHAAPTWDDINWSHGLIGEKEGVEPSLLWRAPGDPIPVLALFINFGILVLLIVKFGGAGITQGLKDRKQRIAGDIERASAMKAEAEDQLAHYEEKLAQMESEMERIKKEMAEQAEADRSRILKDASERRSIIEREARSLIEQELSQARYDATMKAVEGAVKAAREQVEKNLNAQDQERLANDFLGSLEAGVNKTEVPS